MAEQAEQEDKGMARKELITVAEARRLKQLQSDARAAVEAERLLRCELAERVLAEAPDAIDGSRQRKYTGSGFYVTAKQGMSLRVDKSVVDVIDELTDDELAALKIEYSILTGKFKKMLEAHKEDAGKYKLFEYVTSKPAMPTVDIEIGED